MLETRNSSYPARNTSYPIWDNSARGGEGSTPTDLPYRPPGYQEPAKPSVTSNDDLKNLIMAISRHSDQRFDNIERRQDEESRDIKAQFKGVRAHLADLETWKKKVDSPIANLTERIPRPSGQLPVHHDENLRAHIAAVTLRSGKETQ